MTCMYVNERWDGLWQLYSQESLLLPRCRAWVPNSTTATVCQVGPVSALAHPKEM